MSERTRSDGAASASGEAPQSGDIRFTDEGLVEHYDGTAWRPYGELPDDGDPEGATRFRHDDGAGPAQP
ncbi:hypothetical protein PV416_09915 [Streptomyces ipomoeae]|uniref:Uncharacterized protein n=1 Tax=Streptomyces ipomoeae 91-03 TaxID=698759 RepID=L1L4I3_9ACTN|nr:hypothetical protein [Streptomyces ipomoeae]EKX67518.1 hypothetical protein STRIP9103_06662 [Streptomyces ipomoeae 91-03]MDX2693714.1 hypothetical protein [Streptomyces ipomoeae]MDX2821396.1 hypothetical protein [Streptomyces ipomoeae]MDX2839621.1 hypothetical protein [Streptomyces ipomoeae]MDX2880726.1 hypothetical protein [Streptomyces ipomoeae]